MKINSVIIDDEKNSREVLQTLLKKFCPEVTVVGEAQDVNIGYDLIVNKQPDLVFLDVQMPSGNGFSLLKKFKKISFSIIFITSYDEYAINAIKFSAIDYLLKPVEVNELTVAVSKAILKKNENSLFVINLLNNIDVDNLDKKIPLHVQGNVRFINTSSITHIQANGSYSFIYNDDGEKFTSSKTLKEFEEFLAFNPYFIRINKSILLNVKYIKEYSKGDPFVISLDSGARFESSRRKKTEVLEKLGKAKL